MYDMPNPYFQFKQFTIYHDRCVLKVTTDACLFGAWCAAEIQTSAFKIRNVLDIGTGSGLLSLMIVQKNPYLQIDAIEIDETTWAQGKENMLASPWKTQVHSIQADVKEHIFKQRYDCIISNPPFYQNEVLSASQIKNVALHSAALKLEELLVIIKNNLALSGFFFLLLPYKRAKEVEVLLQKHQLFIHKKLWVKQSPEHNYFRIIFKGGLTAQDNMQNEEISIRNKEQQYTPEFISLLQDYYLHL